LQASEHVGERRLRGDARDDADDAGRGEDARPERLHPREREEDGPDRHDRDHHETDAAQHEHLRAHPPRIPVVGDVDRVAGDGAGDREIQQGAQQPSRSRDRDDHEPVVDELARRGLGQRGCERSPHAQHHEQHPQAKPRGGEGVIDSRMPPGQRPHDE
jgi:hypothetical protein